MPAYLIVTIPALAFFVLYGPQPLLPRMAELFAVSESASAFLMTLALLPMAVAPIAYGAALARASCRRVLLISIASLGVVTALFPLADTYASAVIFRLAQGLLLPAVLTAMMTAISRTTSPARMQVAMSGYIAATVGGGMAGRLLAGALATYASWQLFYVLTGLALLATLPALWRLPESGSTTTEPPDRERLRQAWQGNGNWRIFIGVGCLFLVFVGVLNFLPFRIKTIQPEASDLVIAVLYSGYAMGIVAALGANRVINWLGTSTRALIFGFVLVIISLGPLFLDTLLPLFVTIFPLCFGMFLVHALASRRVNSNVNGGSGLVNGIYVSSYYTGGVLGSYLPGLAFERWGWDSMLGLLGIVVAGGLALNAGAPSRRSQ